MNFGLKLKKRNKPAGNIAYNGNCQQKLATTCMRDRWVSLRKKKKNRNLRAKIEYGEKETK